MTPSNAKLRPWRIKKFAERFQESGEAWDVALQIAALRNDAGMSQAELAKKAGTTQQQISRGVNFL